MYKSTVDTSTLECKCNEGVNPAAFTGYSPWVPPFHFDTIAVFDSKGHRVCDMRGWGFLTGGGACNLPEGDAAKIQDAMGEKIADLMNKEKKENVRLAVVRVRLSEAEHDEALLCANTVAKTMSEFIRGAIRQRCRRIR